MTETQRVAVVTGASAGIGKATAKILAGDAWRVIGTGRDPQRSTAAEAEIRAAARDGARVDFLRGDFTLMSDVKRVADEIKGLTDRIDVLINNAGGVRDQRYETAEGTEATFAANHLAPFLLTRELMPLLQATACERGPGKVRVLAVSSSAHEYIPGMKFGDLNMKEGFTTGSAYCQAKLANLLFSRELERRVAHKGIVAQTMHPGRVASNFASHGDRDMQDYMAANADSQPEEPAETLVWMATSDEAGSPGARYFHLKQEVPAAPQALDDAAARQLWDQTEAMLAELGY
ncbi:MAG: SDR family NAD(P)-dependent oxidoreductase [Novosphingobium sp.]|nr:SDR family NAD(P)-dependent oxidoreductase [Novosphingobium sp.]